MHDCRANIVRRWDEVRNMPGRFSGAHRDRKAHHFRIRDTVGSRPNAGPHEDEWVLWKVVFSSRWIDDRRSPQLARDDDPHFVRERPTLWRSSLAERVEECGEA